MSLKNFPRPTSLIAAAVSALLLFACSASVDRVMRYQAPEEADASALVWPEPPEAARYRYVGVLTGESNFEVSGDNQAASGERILRWLVGLGQRLGGDRRELARPQSGVVDGQGRILVTDAGRGAVFVFDEPRGELEIWESASVFTNFDTPVGIVATPGEVLVADAALGKVVRLDLTGEPQGELGADVVERPTGLARDPETGEIYVADTRQHDIKVFSADGRLVRRVGGPGTESGQFNAPTHLAFAGGRLYVSDTLNARIQVLMPDGSPVRLIGRRGLYVGNLTRPKGVTVDGDGSIYVIESYYDHLLVFDQGGQFLLPIGGAGTDPGNFFLPAGVWTNGTDKVFVADMFNGRVVVFASLDWFTP